ncbi:hypothetical protein BDA99DRAFT_528568 [Phascolomyces articulosus]|uniref:SH3 domain-containing protein n=1 Tax=Phascolomyces articulosus TaxID=60185 RepID=A0AAD5JLW8_9FUNG|nr:hypothetical protein BDA99DRAFT_528568 [Phascolomyces articulosus]
MSRHLVVNTQVDRPIPRSTSQWQPSPETSAAIQEEDAIAIKQRNRTNTLYEEEEEEDEDDMDEDDLDDEMDEDEDELDEDDDSTFTSSPSIPDENINFDLVYALHTFVATVEGQASVVKGDALTLLDDSNSYWWLVSVLKTSEVGYIPAENIETPFERLARLNKHRNAEMTSIDQAVHYIPNEKKKKGGRQRRVTMNKDLSVQAQIILTGDDEDHEVGEAYEEWEEDMADDASMLSEYDNDEEEDEDDSIQDDKERNVSSNIVGVPQLQDQERIAAAPKSTTAAAPQSILRSNNNNNNAVSSSSTSSSSTATTSSSALRNIDDKPPQSNTFWRLFSRSKKDNPKANSVIPARVSSEDADSNSISSLASSLISEDKAISRNGQHPNTASSNHNNNNSNSKPSVLRVFAGNVNVGAMYHSMLVDENTSAEQLLIQTMERFHIAQIEDKTAGRSSRAITPTQGSGIEYYLTVKAHNGDEIILAPQDKPLAIFQTLTAHLTTPMPSLTHVKQFSQSTATVDNSASKPRTASGRKGRFGEDSVIRFYLHKRIRRVNEREGQVYIKVSHYTDTKKPTNGNDNALFSAKNLRRKKPSAADASRERIDKLIAISASISIADLTEIALDKFHIVPHGDNDHYRLTVSSQQKADKLLNPSSKLIEVLHDDDSTRDAGEKLFTLRKMSNHHHHHHSQSRSASRESQRSISKVSPEKTQRRPQSYQRSPLSITIRNEKTEDALRRLDAALTALSNSKRKPVLDTKPPMAVIRNVDSGVDIILANGLLSSKILSKNQVQYTVSVNMGDQQQSQPAKPRLVAQKIMQQPLVNGNRPINSSLKNVTENDLDTLVKCGIAFLEAHDRKSGRKPVPSALAGAGAGQHGNIIEAPSLDILDSSAGSLDDLEKEFQRIIASHAF